MNLQSVQEFTSPELVEAVSSLNNRENINWIHFEGRIPEVLQDAIIPIRRLIPNVIISIEFEKPDRPGLINLIGHADVAFFSHTYLRHFQHTHDKATPYDFLAFMRDRNLTAKLVLTAGAEGAFYSALHPETGAVSASHVNVVDSTGAGDTFIAGFIWAMAKLGKGVKQSVELGVRLATAKVAQEGFDGVWDLLDEELKRPQKIIGVSDE
jgi:ketohexokinase